MSGRVEARDERASADDSLCTHPANLFVTQSARLQLEKKGVILFRDSSANKGGVTSSSLEVLAGMSLSDEQFLSLMTSPPGEESFSDFYLDYTRDIQNLIMANGTSEFQTIWAEHERSGRPYTLISNDLSQSLIKLQNELEESTLFDDEQLRKAGTCRDRRDAREKEGTPSTDGFWPLLRLVMARAIPKTLLNEVGLETIMRRLPPAYCHSVFAAWLASRFTYQYGITSSPVDFHYFLSSLTTTAANGVNGVKN